MNTWKLPLGLAACALLAATTDVAFAQADAPVADYPMAPEPQNLPPAPVEPAPVYPAPVYPAPVYPAPVYPGAPYAAPAYPLPAAPYVMPAPGVAAQPAAYPAEYQQARADWVSECADRYRRDRRDGSGGLIGGLLGAVIGGVAGNRIDDDGDRLAGTLIGAGVGGVAGAVIGTLAGKSGRRKLDAEAVDWCEDYLARHTSAPANGYGQPVMMVQVMVPKRGPCPEEVIEEVVEEPRPIRRYIPPRPAPDKRIRLKPSKSKYIKSL